MPALIVRKIQLFGNNSQPWNFGNFFLIFDFFTRKDLHDMKPWLNRFDCAGLGYWRATQREFFYRLGAHWHWSGRYPNIPYVRFPKSAIFAKPWGGYHMGAERGFSLKCIFRRVNTSAISPSEGFAITIFLVVLEALMCLYPASIPRLYTKNPGNMIWGYQLTPSAVWSQHFFRISSYFQGILLWCLPKEYQQIRPSAEVFSVFQVDSSWF